MLSATGLTRKFGDTVVVAYDNVALWVILLSLALNVVAAVLLVRIGARIYNLMATGRKIGFKEALRRP